MGTRFKDKAAVSKPRNMVPARQGRWCRTPTAHLRRPQHLAFQRNDCVPCDVHPSNRWSRSVPWKQPRSTNPKDSPAMIELKSHCSKCYWNWCECTLLLIEMKSSEHACFVKHCVTLAYWLHNSWLRSIASQLVSNRSQKKVFLSVPLEAASNLTDPEFP